MNVGVFFINSLYRRILLMYGIVKQWHICINAYVYDKKDVNIDSSTLNLFIPHFAVIICRY